MGSSGIAFQRSDLPKIAFDLEQAMRLAPGLLASIGSTIAFAFDPSQRAARRLD